MRSVVPLAGGQGEATTGKSGRLQEQERGMNTVSMLNSTLTKILCQPAARRYILQPAQTQRENNIAPRITQDFLNHVLCVCDVGFKVTLEAKQCDVGRHNIVCGRVQNVTLVVALKSAFAGCAVQGCGELLKTNNQE